MTEDTDDIAAYDYDLPPELIAAEPAAERDAARLLVVHRSTQTISHSTVRELPNLLAANDCLVLNNTRVVPARLRGLRQATGGKWEGLYLRTTDEAAWELLGHTRGRLREGETILVESRRISCEPLPLVLVGRGDEGSWLARPVSDRSAFDLLDQYGDVPLPPYIRKGVAVTSDIERYQTVYAAARGSAAAPTAGLHLTHDLLASCRQQGIDQTFVTLHVGVGTFRPVTAARLSEHAMHSEWGELNDVAAARLSETRSSGGRIVAVGTTSVRVLESAASTGELRPFRGETSLFIRPPYQFRAVDVLMTNFHLPRSTLLVLVSTFAGRDLIRHAYEEAIRERYRFFSYGDAMLIL